MYVESEYHNRFSEKRAVIEICAFILIDSLSITEESQTFKFLYFFQ